MRSSTSSDTFSTIVASFSRYFQWSPTHNQNSNNFQVSAGDVLYGSIVFDESKMAYTVNQTATGSTNQGVQMKIPVQRTSKGYKTFTIAYVVYEKVAPCGDYPPDGAVTFNQLILECNGTAVTPQWTTAYVEDVCNNRASVVDPATIKITWDTKADDPAPELIAASQADRTLGGGKNRKAKAALRH